MDGLIKERILSTYQAVSAFDGTPCQRRPKLLCSQGGAGPYFTYDRSHWIAFVYEPCWDENGMYHKDYAYSFGVDGQTEEQALTKLLDWLKDRLVEHAPPYVC